MSSLEKFYFEGLEKSSDKWQSYFEVYDHHINKSLQSVLSHMPPEHPLTFVEVGVQKGGSLEMWGRFFHDESQWGGYPPVNIIGVDVDPVCANLKYEHFPNIEVVIGDQGKENFWDEFLKKHPIIDIFIDDGGHYMDQQILTFEKVFPKLSVGGVYICEDCHTSYMPHNGGGYKYPKSFIEYAKSYIDILHRDWFTYNDEELNCRNILAKDLTSIHFYDSIVVFEKLGKKEMKRVFPNRYKTT